MITSRSQYRITQDRIRRFTATLSVTGGNEPSWHDRLEQKGYREQRDRLEAELATYDRLVSGEIDEIVVERTADLPRALVEARLVAGLEPKELARTTRQDPDDIARWERDGYSRVPVGTLRRIAAVLPIRLTGAAAPGRDRASTRSVRAGLIKAGLPRDVFDRVLAASDAEGGTQDEETELRVLALFRTSAAGFAAGAGFPAPPLRFKLPGNAAQGRTRAYAAYVDGLGAIVAKTQRAEPETLPQEWRRIRTMLFPTGRVDFSTAVRSCWRLGIGVLGLRDPIAFHGACRRRDRRPTIILKQPAKHQSRWLFDLVHEVFHLVFDPGDFTILEAEETSQERRASQEERRADAFAALILTDGAAENALAGVQRLSGGRTERLRSAVVEISSSLDIPIGILANLVADNVRESGRRNWYGAAENLQPRGDDPWKIARDIFLEEADRSALTTVENQILERVLETQDD